MNMMKKTTLPGAGESPARKRPFFLTALCLASFIFFGLISLLLLVSLLYSGSFRNLINTYVTGAPVSFVGVFFVLLLMCLLTAAAFTGTLLMWRLKRKGFFIFGIPVLAIASYQLVRNEVPVLSTAILIFFLVSFGIFYKYYR
jgi:hypothetical protein